MDTKFGDTIDAEVRPLMEGYVLNASIAEDLTAAADLAEVFAVLQFLEQKIDERKKVIRQRLLYKAEQTGVSTDKGGQFIKTAFGSITREKRISKMPEEADIKILLGQNDVPFEDAFSEQKKMVLDPSKLEQLVMTGKLLKDAVESARRVTYALKFKPTPVVAERMEAMVPQEDVE